MKLNRIVLFSIFLSSIFIGIVVISIGFGAIFPSLNRIARPFICPRGEMELETHMYRPYPGEMITSLTWYCVDQGTSQRTELGLFSIALYAGVIYGLLLFVVAIVGWFLYLPLNQRWGPYLKTAKGQKWAEWIRYSLIGVFIVGMLWLGFTPWPTLEGTITHSTPTRMVDATAASIALTFHEMSSGTPIAFTSTEKPLASWNGIPVMPEAIAGQEVNHDRYAFHVPVDSGTIESFYSDTLKSLGWNLVDKQWLGMELTNDKQILLVTYAPASDLQSWVVTLALIP